jgi:hypothetical protein
MYASIIYQTDLLGGLLLNIFVDFIIETEIKSEKQLINNQLDGKYQIRIKIDENIDPKIIDLDLFTGNKLTIEALKTLIDTEEMRSIISDLMDDRRRDRKEKLGQMDTSHCIPKPRYNFNVLVEQYKRQEHNT